MAPGGIVMGTNTSSQENTERKIITTKNSPELKERMKKISAEILDVNVNIRMYNFDDVQCTVIPSVAYGFVTGMNLQLC